MHFELKCMPHCPIANEIHTYAARAFNLNHLQTQGFSPAVSVICFINRLNSIILGKFYIEYESQHRRGTEEYI